MDFHTMSSVFSGYPRFIDGCAEKILWFFLLFLLIGNAHTGRVRYSFTADCQVKFGIRRYI